MSAQLQICNILVPIYAGWLHILKEEKRTFIQTNEIRKISNGINVTEEKIDNSNECFRNAGPIEISLDIVCVLLLLTITMKNDANFQSESNAEN